MEEKLAWKPRLLVVLILLCVRFGYDYSWESEAITRAIFFLLARFSSEPEHYIDYRGSCLIQYLVRLLGSSGSLLSILSGSCSPQDVRQGYLSALPSDIGY